MSGQPLAIKKYLNAGCSAPATTTPKESAGTGRSNQRASRGAILSHFSHFSRQAQAATLLSPHPCAIDGRVPGIEGELVGGRGRQQPEGERFQVLDQPLGRAAAQPAPPGRPCFAL